MSLGRTTVQSEPSPMADHRQTWSLRERGSSLLFGVCVARSHWAARSIRRGRGCRPEFHAHICAGEPAFPVHDLNAAGAR